MKKQISRLLKSPIVHLCLLFVYPFFTFSSFYQDSIRELLIKHPGIDQEKIILLSKLSFETWHDNAEEARNYGIQALEIADSLSDDRGKAYANLAIGVGIWGQENYNVAIEHFLLAENIIKEVGDSNDIILIKYEIGKAYLSEAILDLANKNFRMALDYYRSKHNLFMQAMSFKSLGIAHNIDRNYERSIERLDSAIIYFKKLENRYELAECYLYLGICKINLNQSNEANKLFTMALSEFIESEDKRGIVIAEREIGKAFLNVSKLDSAEIYLNRALESSKKYQFNEQLITIYYNLYDLELKRENYKAALDYYIKHVESFDKRINQQISYEVHDMKMKYDKEKSDHEIALLNQDKELKSTYIVFLSILIILISIGGLIAGILIRNNRKRDRLLQDSKQALMEAEISNAKLKEKELMLELEKKNLELTSYTMNFIQKGTLLNELMEKLSAIDDGGNEKLASSFRELKNTLKIHMNSDKDWEDFKIFFENVHPSFTNTLIQNNPDLSQADIKLATLLKLNLNSKQISDVMGISPDSVKTARHRLRNKLNLNRDQNLTQYLNKLEAEELIKGT